MAWLDELMARVDIEDEPGRVLPGTIDSFPQTIEPPSNGVPVLAARQAGARSTAVHRSRISTACWSAFQEACAHHGVLPNAVLSAALMLAMQESGQERPGMRFWCAVSWRRQAQGDGALLGNYVGFADAEPCPAGSALLDAAKDHQVKLVVSGYERPPPALLVQNFPRWTTACGDRLSSVDCRQWASHQTTNSPGRP